jgi:alginate O-acetyltransferase complex protein AlgF
MQGFYIFKRILKQGAFQMKITAKLLLGVAFIVFTGHAQAQDAGLYDPVAPEGSAFVRFINAEDDAAITPTIGGKNWPEVQAEAAGPYIPLKAENVEVKAGRAMALQTLEKNTFYTAVIDDDKITIIKDQAITNPAKALIGFYNLADDGALSLKTREGKTEIVSPVAQGQSGYRDINGVKVETAVFNGKTKLTDVEPMNLQRGQAFSVVVLDNDDVKVFKNTTDTAP